MFEVDFTPVSFIPQWPKNIRKKLRLKLELRKKLYYSLNLWDLATFSPISETQARTLTQIQTAGILVLRNIEGKHAKGFGVHKTQYNSTLGTLDASLDGSLQVWTRNQRCGTGGPEIWFFEVQIP